MSAYVATRACMHHSTKNACGACLAGGVCGVGWGGVCKRPCLLDWLCAALDRFRRPNMSTTEK